MIIGIIFNILASMNKVTINNLFPFLFLETHVFLLLGKHLIVYLNVESYNRRMINFERNVKWLSITVPFKIINV